MNYYKLPKDKLVFIVNYVRKLIFLADNSKQDITEKVKLNLLSYPLLRSKIHRLVSNLDFVEKFRSVVCMSSEEDFCLSLMMRTLENIEGLQTEDVQVENSVVGIYELESDCNVAENEKFKMSEVKQENLVGPLVKINVEKFYETYFEHSFSETTLDKFTALQGDFELVCGKVDEVQECFGDSGEESKMEKLELFG